MSHDGQDSKASATSMRILVVSTYYAPDVCGIAPMITDLCDGLADRNHEVTVLTSFPHYPEWKNKSGCWPWSKAVECQKNGVEVIRHGAYIPNSSGGIFARLLYEGTMLLSLLRSLFIRSGQFDAVYAVCPSVGNLLYARLRTFLTREPVVINVQDIPADAANASGLASGWLGRLAASFQSWLFNSGSALTTISEPMAERINQSVRQPTVLTPNWLVGEIADAVSQVNSDDNVHSERPTVPDLFYSGNIGNKQGLIEFCDRLKQCDFEFHFTIHGCGSAVDKLEKWHSLHGDSRFRLGPLLDSVDFVDRLKNAGWFVITEKSGMGAAVMPSKLIPAVSLGIPILAICDADGALGRVVSGRGLGIHLGWDSLDRVEESLLHITEDERAAMQENCLAISATFDRQVGISSIEQILQGVRKAPRMAAVPV